MLQITLAPDGRLRLIFPTHRIDLDLTRDGAVDLLLSIVQSFEIGQTQVGSAGAPTQAQVISALLGTSWGEGKQLAGDRKRWSEIKSATGVVVKIKKFDPKGKRQNLSLEDIGL